MEGGEIGKFRSNSVFLRSTGFTPLILAATAGHVGVVEVLLDKGGDIEAQSERTKDTPLSLACSGGRQEVTHNIQTLYFNFFSSNNYDL